MAKKKMYASLSIAFDDKYESTAMRVGILQKTFASGDPVKDWGDAREEISKLGDLSIIYDDSVADFVNQHPYAIIDGYMSVLPMSMRSK